MNDVHVEIFLAVPGPAGGQSVNTTKSAFCLPTPSNWFWLLNVRVKIAAQNEIKL
jgi:hypothetical protein